MKNPLKYPVNAIIVNKVVKEIELLNLNHFVLWFNNQCNRFDLSVKHREVLVDEIEKKLKILVNLLRQPED